MKMTGSSHHICSRINVTADYSGSESEAHLFLKELPHMVNSALDYLSDELDNLPVLKHRSIRFRQLSIDIGLIDERYFKDEFKNRLKKALIEKIDQVELNSGVSDPEVESVDISLETDRLIRHLLCFGNAPWWAGRHHTLQLHKLINEYINKSPGQAAELFRDIGHLPEVRRRFIQRLENPSLQSLIKLFQPVESDFINRVFDLLTRYANEKGLKESDIRFIIGDAFFEYLVSNSSRKFSRSDFIETVTRRVLSKDEFEKDSFAQYIISNNETGAERELIQVLKEKRSKPAKRKGKKNQQLTDDWIYLKNILLQDIQENSSSIKSAVRSGWKKLFKHGDQPAFAKIKTLAGSRLVRYNLSILLPDKDLRHIIKLAEPANATFILDQSRRTVKIRESIPDLQIPEKNLKAKSWEFILTYLFEDKGSQFNRKQFLRSTLDQFAAHYNLRYSSLLKYFILLTSDEKTGSSLAVHSLLKDLEKDEQSHRRVEREPPLWEAPERLASLTEKAGLLTFSGIYRSAEELYQFAKRDPDRLNQLLKTGGYSEEGLIYIWSFLSRSQKGIVLMAVSPPKISGWEQIISQIEIIAAESGGLSKSVELDTVFNLVFRHGVLNDVDMEVLLSLYLDELAAENRSTKKKILGELSSKHIIADDRLLLKYLKLQPDSASKKGSGYTKNQEQLLKGPIDPLLYRIDQLFQSVQPDPSRTIINLFKSLDENELANASAYISSKRGWRILAGKVLPENWREWAELVLKGEILDAALAVHDLFLQIYSAEFSGNKPHVTLRKIQEEMTHILLHHPADINGRRLMQRLLMIEKDESRIRLKPEAIRQIQKTVSSAQTPFFNQWMEWQNASPGSSVQKEPDSEHEETQDLVRVLNLLKKLERTPPDSDDIRQFPLLMHFLDNREDSVERALFKSLRDPEIVKRWAKRLPASLLLEITGRLLPEKHLNEATEMLHQLRPVTDTVQLQISKQRLEAKILFKYSAGHRYQAYNSSEFIKQILFLLAESLPSSVRDKRIKELSEQIIKLLKKLDVRDIKSIKKVVHAFSAEPMEARPGSLVSGSEESDDFKSLKKAFDLDEQNFEGEALYINRAGLVLAAPFFPSLFNRLGYLNNGEFIDDDVRSRAIHVMEYLVTGREIVEEHNLVIQKFLAGLPVQSPVDPVYSLTDEEKEMSESMLNGLIGNWPALQNTTVNGLRESFLLRDGRLQKAEDQWVLTVERKAFDMLLDQVPWSISMIKLPWMKYVLKVDWR